MFLILNLSVTIFLWSVNIHKWNVNADPLDSMRRRRNEIVSRDEGKWYVSVQKRTYRGWVHICGGVLINPTQVVTSTYCFHDEDVLEDVNVLSVLIGVHNLGSENEGSTRIEIHGWINVLHHSFDKGKLADDIAIAQLMTCAMEFPGGAILPILPANVALTEKNRAIVCGVCGWGNLEASHEPALRKGKVFLINGTNCEEKLGHISDNDICAEDEHGGFRHFDVGTPLVCVFERVNYLAGIAVSPMEPFFKRQHAGLYKSVVSPEHRRFLESMGKMEGKCGFVSSSPKTVIVFSTLAALFCCIR